MNIPFQNVTSAFFGWLWESSWHASLIALAILVVQRVLGPRLGAEWRYGLWLVVILRLLLPDMPAAATSVYNVVPPPALFASEGVREAMGYQGGGPLSTDVSAPAGAKNSQTSTGVPWWGLIGLGWVAGVAVLACRSFLATMRFRRVILRAGRMPSSRTAELLAESSAVLKMRAPRLLECPSVASPIVMGIVRPVIVLPPRLEDRFTAEEIRLILLHELAHIKRGDLWTSLLVGMLQGLHWFNPILWFAFRRLRHDRELACDARVLRTQEPEGRSAYGHTLIKVLEGLHSDTRAAGVVGILENRAQLRQRMGRIVRYVRPTRLAVIGGVGLLAILMLTMLTRAANEKKGEKSPTAAQGTAREDTAASKPGAGSYSDRILAAARRGDGKLVVTTIDASSDAGASIGVEGATQLLNSLVTARELPAFLVLLDELRQTNLGKDWQPNDALLAGLVKDGRTDFLDGLMARRLDLGRLQAQAANGDAKTAGWIARRTAEVEKQRADIDKLIDASANGDLETMRRLLDAGVDVNGRNTKPDSWTPLTRAVAKNRENAVRLLLERGAEVDKPKHPGWDYTPLCLAHSVEICQILKDAGANLHANLFGRQTSILTYAVKFNGAEVTQWFLDQGLDPRMIGDNDQTLLFGVKDAATAEILLKAGVDPNRLDEFGEPAIANARNAGVVKALIKGGAKLSGFKRPLIPGMIQMSSDDAVAAVLEAIPKPDSATLQKALISAAHIDRNKAAEALIKYGAKANEPGEWSGPDDLMLPLQVCCIFGSPKTARVLLAHGADPNGGKIPG